MSLAKFYLQNDIGQRVDLGALSDIVFTHASGLGRTLSPVYTDLGKGFFNMVNNENEPQQTIAGDMVFTENSYPRFREFMNWAEAAGELLFVYCPYGSEEYYRRVILTSMEKGVRGAWGQLSCAVSMTCLTPWYLPTAVEMTVEDVGTDAARYAYRLNADRYGTAGGKYAVHIPAKGHVPTALTVRYTGAAKNLTFTLRGAVSGTEYGRCVVRGESLEGETTELCTQPRNSYITRSGVDLLESNLVDIRYEPFFRAPNDEETVLQASDDEGLGGVMSVEAYYYYRSV